MVNIIISDNMYIGIINYMTNAYNMDKCFIDNVGVVSNKFNNFNFELELNKYVKLNDNDKKFIIDLVSRENYNNIKKMYMLMYGLSVSKESKNDKISSFICNIIDSKGFINHYKIKKAAKKNYIKLN